MRIKLLWLFFPALLFAAAANTAGERWWSHVRTLADDKFEGRGAASEGYRQAVEYVAAQFKRLGLKPAGKDGYRQPVPLEVRTIREADSSLLLTRGRVTELLQLGEDAYINLPSDPPPSVQAQAVFVGYGLTVPELNYDDLQGIDLKGKIAVLLRGGPASIPGPLLAHYQSVAERWPFLRKAGAIGIASILNPSSMDVPWERLKLLRLEPSMSLPTSARDETPSLSLTINPASADRLFLGTGHSMEEILAAAKEEKPLPRFPLEYTISAMIAADRTTATSDNVAAILPGTDARLRNEYVIVSAHLDGIGKGSPIGGDSIYNGAMDDAAGVASLFEIARTLRASPPRRSVLFLAVTGEEKGLLGSKYFAASPTVSLGSIVADLNLDMYQPLHSLKRLIVYGQAESTLGADATRVAKRFGVLIQPDPQPERIVFVRSDQYSFIRAGVPSLAVKFGFAKGSAEERIQAEWLKARYHAPSDDAAQPVNIAAAARFNRLMAALVADVANKAQRPRWNADSFFRRFAATAGR